MERWLRPKLKKREREINSAVRDRLRQSLFTAKETSGVTEEVVKTPSGREIFIAVLDPKRAFSDLTAVVGEAHADDAILGEGINIISSEMGVGVTYVTMTDGSNRDLDGFAEPRDLALKRRQESKDAAEKAGAAMVIHLGYRDGELKKNKKEAAAELKVILDAVNPRYMTTPNRLDKHKDHYSTYKIARRAKRKKDISLYGTDTQSTKGRWKIPLRPTHYFAVSQEVKSRRDDEYNTHTSQVNVQYPDRKDVDQVFAMPEVRGKQKGWKYGGVLYKAWFDKDTLGPLLQQNEIPFMRRVTPKVIYEKAKRRFA